MIYRHSLSVCVEKISGKFFWKRELSGNVSNKRSVLMGVWMLERLLGKSQTTMYIVHPDG